MSAKIITNPDHYCLGREYEPRKVIYDWGLDFNLGSAVKYISRAGRKGDPIEDLKKARQFLDFEIEELELKKAEIKYGGKEDRQFKNGSGRYPCGSSCETDEEGLDEKELKEFSRLFGRHADAMMNGSIDDIADTLADLFDYLSEEADPSIDGLIADFVGAYMNDDQAIQHDVQEKLFKDYGVIVEVSCKGPIDSPYIKFIFD